MAELPDRHHVKIGVTQSEAVPGSLPMITFACRVGCGACCIVPSISSPIPGMPNGKPAGVRCIQLTDDNCCQLFGLPERPRVCVNLAPSADMCGDSNQQAFALLEELERLTRPDRTDPDG